jgi:large subunit ribosomal protein L10
MAISRAQKEQQVAELSELLAASRMTVMAQYSGMSVTNSQALRSKAKENNTTIKVVKNRLVKVALDQVEALKGADTSLLNGQLLYAFNPDDEVAPAQALAQFAKEHPELKLIGAIDAEGNTLDEAQITRLASLPSKDQLRGQLVGVLAGPARGLVTVLSGNLRGLVNVLNAHKDNLEKA